jgi:DNA-binding transcriptional LysR family regulator
MELRHLRYFLAVAHYRNFTQAARELHLAQPPLSQQIQQLERELGVTLFDRSARQIALTPAGLELERRALALFEQVEDLIMATRDVAEARAGSVTLGVIPTAAGVLVPQIATQLRDRLPAVELIIKEGGSTTIAELVVNRKADMGLARFPLSAAIGPELLITESLQQEPVVLVVPQGHRFAVVPTINGDRPGIPVAALRDEPLMLVRRDQGTLSDLVLDACAEAGFVPKIVCEGAEIDTLVRLVAAGVGLTFVPASGLWLMPHLRDHVVGIPLLAGPDEHMLTLTMGLIWRRQGYRSRAALELATIIHELIAS